jgi:hypothetical protein
MRALLGIGDAGTPANAGTPHDRGLSQQRPTRSA